MKTAAARASAWLSLLFLAVYGGSNWIAAHRAAVGVWYFAWERRIPFVPILIVPYLSLDAFFVVAPFLCRDRAELGAFVRRVSLAVAAAGVFFLVMPLRFAFARPAVHGWTGVLFTAFGAFDRPFNLFPSLHIALAAILVDTYARHTRGPVRVALWVWFALIGVSTVATYQHHVIDVAGGLLLGTLVFYGVRERGTGALLRGRGTGALLGETQTRDLVVVRNLRIAGYYLLGAGAAAGAAAAAWPWSSVLVWPAVSLAIVGSAYLGVGPRVFRKAGGAGARSARVLLWPCLAGQWVSLWLYQRQCRPYDEVAPGVLIGRRLSEREAAEAVARGVTAVLDLTAEFSEPPAFRQVAYRNIQILDLTAPALTDLQDAAGFIAEQAARGVVYVHCKIGYSRSAAAVGAWLLTTGRARTADEAVARLRAVRPSIIVRPEALDSLRRFEAAAASGPDGDDQRRSMPSVVVSVWLAAIARLVCGTSARWIGCEPTARQRIYFANHSSHLDFVVLWASLPPEIRAHTRPVAGRDYWGGTRMRRYLSRRVFRAILVDRRGPGVDPDRDAIVAMARHNVERTAHALGTDESLIIFPEGTRGSGLDVAPFKSGLYYLARRRPDVELVPTYLENLNRILPKGETLPVPLVGTVTFGRPMHLAPGEDKDGFLARARAELVALHRSCPYYSTAISRAW